MKLFRVGKRVPWLHKLRLGRLPLVCLALLAGAAVPAWANDSACQGQDMMDAMKAANPKGFAAMRAEEKNTPHADGLLFRLTRKGRPELFVFGTIHVDDPRFKIFPKELLAALDRADVVATEIKESDLSNPVTALKMLTFAVNPKADTFDAMAIRDRAAVEKAIQARGLSSGAAARMDAGFLLLSIALPPCAMEDDPAKALTKEIVDQKVARLGIAAGAENVGLEEVIDQINAIKDLSSASKRALLVATANADDQSTNMYVTMKNLYHARKIGRLGAAATLTLPPDPAVQGAYAEFKDRLIDRRNQSMAAKIEGLAKTKKVVVAIGALHLPGENGVIRRLERAGYKATRLW